MKPRPYQSGAIEALEHHLKTKKTSPCVVLPTGAGKSFVMALAIDRWAKAYPALKVLILAHRSELVEQNSLELAGLAPHLDIGVYAASLKRRETTRKITFAAIDSVANKADAFGRVDMIMVDEAHRIPASGEGRYRKFIDAVKGNNPNMRLVGLTATPYRLGVGSICHRDHLLNEVCYEANVADLIRDGYLSELRTVRGESELNLEGVKKSAGEYNLKDLALRVDVDNVVKSAVRHMVQAVKGTKRKSVIVFCINVEHVKHVQAELVRYGIAAPYVVGETSNAERARLIEEFRAGKHQFLLSVNVFTEGFNVKQVDCVAMLRPTQSKGLWIQAVGRGLRTHPDKDYCLILDYGNNINQHGPIDLSDEEDIRLTTCHVCGNEYSRAVRVCPSCKAPMEKKTVEFVERLEAAERQMHEAKASDGYLLSAERWLKVDGVLARRHKKAGKPDSLRLEYQCGLTIVKEWFALDSNGYPAEMAHIELAKRGWPAASVEDFLDSYPAAMLTASTHSILVGYKGKYMVVKEFKKKPK